MNNPTIPKGSFPHDLQKFLFTDGLQHSVHMSDLSYRKLCADLLVVSKNYYARCKEGKITLTKEAIFTYEISALSNAWQVIDSVNRLRELLIHAPGIRKRDTEYKVFFRQTENVKHLRDNIQHLNNQIPQFIRDRIPAWGTLNWVSKLDESDELLLFSLVLGTLFERNTPLLNPVGRTITIPIGIITLSSDIEVCLSDLVEIQVRGIADWLQKIQNIDFASPAPFMIASLVFTPNIPDSLEAQL